MFLPHIWVQNGFLWSLCVLCVKMELLGFCSERNMVHWWHRTNQFCDKLFLIANECDSKIFWDFPLGGIDPQMTNWTKVKLSGKGNKHQKGTNESFWCVFMAARFWLSRTSVNELRIAILVSRVTFTENNYELILADDSLFINQEWLMQTVYTMNSSFPILFPSRKRNSLLKEDPTWVQVFDSEPWNFGKKWPMKLENDCAWSGEGLWIKSARMNESLLFQDKGTEACGRNRI